MARSRYWLLFLLRSLALKLLRPLFLFQCPPPPTGVRRAIGENNTRKQDPSSHLFLSRRCFLYCSAWIPSKRSSRDGFLERLRYCLTYFRMSLSAVVFPALTGVLERMRKTASLST